MESLKHELETHIHGWRRGRPADKVAISEHYFTIAGT